MNRIKEHLFIATAIFALTAVSAFSLSAVEFLNIAPDARSVAMGGVSAALSDNVNAIFHNPASLGNLRRPEVSVSHSLWLNDFSMEHAAFVIPTPKSGKIGAFFSTLLMGSELQGFDLTGNETENVSFNNMVFGISYGSPKILGVDNKVYVGGTFKYFSETLAGDSASAMLLDIGILSDNFLGDGWNLGASFQNIPLTKPNFGDKAEKVDVNVKVGINYELLISRSKMTLIGMLPEIDYNSVNSMISMGVEMIYRMIPQKFEIALRTGYKTQQYFGLLSSLCFGLGLKYKNYALDYSFNSYDSMGNTHRFSLILKF